MLNRSWRAYRRLAVSFHTIILKSAIVINTLRYMTEPEYGLYPSALSYMKTFLENQQIF